MYSDELEHKYGQYLCQWDIFLFNKCFVDVETISPKYDFNHKNIDKFFVTKIKILNGIFNKNIFIDLFSEAILFIAAKIKLDKTKGAVLD